MHKERTAKICKIIILIGYFLWMSDIIATTSATGELQSPVAASTITESKTTLTTTTRYYAEKDYSYLLDSYGRDNKVLRAKLQQYHEHVNKTNYLLCRLNMLAETGKTKSIEYGKTRKQFSELSQLISFQENCFNILDKQRPTAIDDTRCGVLTTR